MAFKLPSYQLSINKTSCSMNYFTMAFMMRLLYSIVAFYISVRHLEVSAASCCLRTSPMHRLSGLDLQNNLIRNKHTVNSDCSY